MLYPDLYPESRLYPEIFIPIPDPIRLYPDLGNTKWGYLPLLRPLGYAYVFSKLDIINKTIYFIQIFGTHAARRLCMPGINQD